MGITAGQSKGQFFASAFRQPGCCIEGGHFIGTNGGGVAFIVAPVSTEATTSWSGQAAVNNAEAAIPCGDWFIPNLTDLLNPGYENKTGWDGGTAPTGRYWSSTCCGGFGFNNPNTGPQYVLMSTGFNGSCYATDQYLTRAFRCVTY